MSEELKRDARTAAYEYFGWIEGQVTNDYCIPEFEAFIDAWKFGRESRDAEIADLREKLLNEKLEASRLRLELAALKAKLGAVQKYSSSITFDFHFHRECEYREDLPDLCRTHNYEVCPVPTIKAIIDGTEATDAR